VRRVVDEAVANREEPTKAKVRQAACRAQRVHPAHAQEFAGPHDSVTQISENNIGASMNVIDHDRMIGQLLAVLAGLGWQPAPGGDAIEQLARFELLRGDDAAFVAGRRDTSTLARWAQAADDEGEPIAFKVGGAWMFITRRLLDFIERKFKLSARREAETKLRKLRECGAGSQRSTSNSSQRAGADTKTCDNIDSKLALDPDHMIADPRAVGME
jgi:hypothetical protein